jgi:CubicO group peptidase (beta-lactamase class C family)
MNLRKWSSAAILILSAVVSLSCLTYPVETRSELEAKLDELIAPLVEKDLFSGSILVAKGGEIILQKGYGLADREHGVACAPDTKYRLGSVTKQFTSMMIMQMQEEGLLSVEDALSKYIPDYPNGEEITIHHLLTHTSGVPNFTSFPDYEKTMMIPTTLEEIIARFKDKPLDFEPGERFSYSNSGYILLSYILEKVSGKSWETLLHERITGPLGLEETGYDRHETILPQRAIGYALDGLKVVNSAYIDMSIPSGAGAMYSTVRDLYKWDRALYTDKLLKKESLERMFTPFKSNYGYGWMIRDEDGRKLIAHGGGINGFVTVIKRYVDDDTVIVALCNMESPYFNKVVETVTALVWGKEPQPIKVRTAIEVDRKLLEEYAGKYMLNPQFIITFTVEDGRFYTQATNQPKFEVFAESETDFFLMVVDAQVTFVRGDDGKVSHLILHQGGQDQKAVKVE